MYFSSSSNLSMVSSSLRVFILLIAKYILLLLENLLLSCQGLWLVQFLPPLVSRRLTDDSVQDLKRNEPPTVGAIFCSLICVHGVLKVIGLKTLCWPCLLANLGKRKGEIIQFWVGWGIFHGRVKSLSKQACLCQVRYQYIFHCIHRMSNMGTLLFLFCGSLPVCGL